MIEWMSRRELLEAFMEEYDIIGLIDATDVQMIEFIQRNWDAPLSRQQERNRNNVTERGTMEAGGDGLLYSLFGIPQQRCGEP